jgi:hypothetical protein
VPIVSCFVWTRSFTIGRRWRRHWSTQPEFRPPQSTSVVRSRGRTSAVTPSRLTTSAPLPGRGEFAFADGDPRSGRPLASCITNVRTLVRARPKHFAESLCCRSYCPVFVHAGQPCPAARSEHRLSSPAGDFKSDRIAFSRSLP